MNHIYKYFNSLFTRKIYALLFVVTVIVILLIYHLPDLISFLQTPTGMVFMGQNHSYDPWDVNIYVSATRYGQNGHFLLPNLYSSLPNKPIFIYSFYTLAGLLFKSINPFLLFHLLSIVMGLFLLLTIFSLIRKIGFSTPLSLFALITISLGGGLGFLLFNKLPSADIDVSAVSFFSSFQKPHEALGILSYLTALVAFYELTTQTQQKIYLKILIICSLILALIIYPYFITTFVTIGISYILSRNKRLLFKKETLNLIIFFVFAICIDAFIYFQFSENPTFTTVLNQHLTIGLTSLLFGYGILMPLFIYQLFFIKKTPLSLFLTIWVIVTLLFSILPIGPGKIFLRGLFFPLVLLGILSLQHIVNLSHKKEVKAYLKPAIFTAFFILLISTSIFIFTKFRLHNDPSDTWVYRSYDEFQAFNFLQNHTAKNSSILALYTLSNQIPAFTHNRVFFGHPNQTPDSDIKQHETISFFTGFMSTNKALHFLQTNNISYIVVGKEEQSLNNLNHTLLNSLTIILSRFKKVFKNQEVTVYATDL